jgi:hypothetical protein
MLENGDGSPSNALIAARMSVDGSIPFLAAASSINDRSRSVSRTWNGLRVVCSGFTGRPRFVASVFFMVAPVRPV